MSSTCKPEIISTLFCRFVQKQADDETLSFVMEEMQKTMTFIISLCSLSRALSLSLLVALSQSMLSTWSDVVKDVSGAVVVFVCFGPPFLGQCDFEGNNVNKNNRNNINLMLFWLLLLLLPLLIQFSEKIHKQSELTFGSSSTFQAPTTTTSSLQQQLQLKQ